MGDSFVPRLGPSGQEPFAAMEDVVDDPDGEWPARPSHQTPIAELRFVALDCETTGQAPHGLVELGAVAFTLDSHLMSFETLVHSTDRINPYARRIHGIGAESLGGAPSVGRVLERFRRFAKGAVLVEHSADAFDTRLIASTMETPLDADNLDTSRMAGAIWELRDTIGLERMCVELNVHHRRPHHALADAEATAECFVELVRLGGERFGWRTLGDLLAVAQPPPPRINDERRGRRRPADGMRPANGASASTATRRRRRGGRRHRRPQSSTAPPVLDQPQTGD
ncbi:MAG: 3'-5' exonuclease [Candidatus Dormibacteraeota bacterium]|uniref:3'-5' exonuclease n=1 Tax=Candidatus Amunia macphersoniae TaxID=3127014 RepID=A0A934KP54_9BACT|nr:3'-5' exonuclease [Candidatus Dormibacteraeota bacterium]